ncbi:hypothetical protein F4679DRAFT_587070 [Xylaria curta]|nr:hypothetical protein F4679DRAFT_587070 [Xylaria curta]
MSYASIKQLQAFVLTGAPTLGSFVEASLSITPIEEITCVPTDYPELELAVIGQKKASKEGEKSAFVQKITLLISGKVIEGFFYEFMEFTAWWP